MYRELFQRRGLSLERLQALVRVADASSLIEAAEQNPVMQSQFSRQLRELENFFGCALTERRGKNLIMSPAGWRLAKLSRLYLSGLHDFMQEQKRSPRLIRVGAGERLSRWLLMPHLGAIPDADRVTFAFQNLSSADIITKLHSHELDFGLVRSTKTIPRPLKAIKLGKLRYGYFGASRHMPSSSKRTSLCQPYARLADVNDERRQQINQEIVQHVFGRKVTPHYVCSTMPTVANLVQSGLAGAVLPVKASREFDAKNIRMIALNADAAVHETIWMVWNPRLVDLIPANEKFIHAMTDIVGAQLTED